MRASPEIFPARDLAALDRRSADVANMGLDLYAQVAPEDWVRPLIDTHKSVGITILGLAVLRLSWRLSHSPPPMPAGFRAWERASGACRPCAALRADIRAAADRLGARFRLEGLGGASDALVRPVPLPAHRRHGQLARRSRRTQWHDGLGAAHHYAGYVLYALLALHILGALKHQFLDKQPEMQRMGLYPPQNP